MPMVCVKAGNYKSKSVYVPSEKKSVMLLHILNSINFVIRQEKNNIMNQSMINKPYMHKPMYQPPKHIHINKNHKVQRRNHNIHQPGFDVQRKNFNRKC